MNFRTRLYPFSWLLLAFIINGSSLSSLYAQNTEFEKLFEEAKEQQYSNPQKSLDLYKYLLKTDLDAETQFSIYLEQLHTYQILAQYNHAVEVKQVVDNLANSITDKELLFKYWLQTVFLYHNLDFPKEAQNALVELEVHFDLLSVEQKHRNRKYLDYTLVLLDSSYEESNKIEKLKTIEGQWTQDEAKYAWLSYELAELYFDKYKDSSLLYFDKVLGSQNHLLNPVTQIYKEWIQNDVVDSTAVSLQVIENESLQYKLKIAFLKHLITYLGVQSQPNKLVQYTDKLDKLKLESSLAKRQAKTLLLENIYYKDRDLAILKDEKEKQKELLIIFGLSICLLAYSGFWFYRKKKRIAKAEKVHDKEITKSKLIPDKTEEEILKRLEAFEKSTLYLDEQLRIATLAKHLQTNTRYLSLILNKRKNKSFNNYINQLRISYIINKLNNDSIYLNYKISYLAKESGFASQSSFSTFFKDFTGMSPSAYIKNIADKKKG